MVGAMLVMWLRCSFGICSAAGHERAGAIMLSGVAAMGFFQFYQIRMKFSLVCGLWQRSASSRSQQAPHADDVGAGHDKAALPRNR